MKFWLFSLFYWIFFQINCIYANNIKINDQLKKSITTYLERKTNSIDSHNSFSILTKKKNANFKLDHFSYWQSSIQISSTSYKENQLGIENINHTEYFKGNRFNFQIQKSNFTAFNFGNQYTNNYILGNYTLRQKQLIDNIKNPYLNFITNSEDSYNLSFYYDFLENLKYNFLFHNNAKQIHPALNIKNKENFCSRFFLHEFLVLYRHSSTSMEVGKIIDKSFFQRYSFPGKNLLEISFISVAYTREIMPEKLYFFSQYIQARHRFSNENYAKIQSKNIKNIGLFAKNIFQVKDKIAITTTIYNTNKKHVLDFNDLIALPSYFSIEYLLQINKKHELKTTYSRFERSNRFMINYVLI